MPGRNDWKPLVTVRNCPEINDPTEMSEPSASAFGLIPPYLIVDGFLGDELIGRLLEHARLREADFVPTKVGTHEAILDPGIRVSRVLRDFGELRDDLKARFKDVMQRAIEDLRISPFELARCEIELVAHNDGAFYKKHIDTQTGIPDEKTQRALTGVLYFHSLPKNFSGGEFRLFSLNSERFVGIEPERDRLVLFPAWAPHEVLPVSCSSGKFTDSRFALNCWYRRHNPHKKDNDG